MKVRIFLETLVPSFPLKRILILRTLMLVSGSLSTNFIKDRFSDKPVISPRDFCPSSPELKTFKESAASI